MSQDSREYIAPSDIQYKCTYAPLAEDSFRAGMHHHLSPYVASIMLIPNLVTATWIDNHKYVVKKNQALAVLLVATEVVDPNDDSDSLLQVDCGFGYFQV